MYSFIKIPSFANKSFFDFTKEEAKEYFHWFLSIKEERIWILEKHVKSLYAQWAADYTQKSLLVLYEWFEKVVAYRPMDESEKESVRMQLASTPLQANVIPIPTQTFTDETVSICFDLGAYFGEIIIANTVHVKWMQKITSTNFIDYAQPLVGKKNIKAPVNPRRVAEGYARRILDSKVEETPPYNLYEVLLNKFQ